MELIKLLCDVNILLFQDSSSIVFVRFEEQTGQLKRIVCTVAASFHTHLLADVSMQVTAGGKRFSAFHSNRFIPWYGTNWESGET